MKIKKSSSINSETSGNSQMNVASGETHTSVDLGTTSPIKYETPLLVSYGDVRDVTLGPTAGFGESGCEFARRVGNPPSCP